MSCMLGHATIGHLANFGGSSPSSAGQNRGTDFQSVTWKGREEMASPFRETVPETD